jgi:hypothetical protein
MPDAIDHYERSYISEDLTVEIKRSSLSHLEELLKRYQVVTAVQRAAV